MTGEAFLRDLASPSVYPQKLDAAKKHVLLVRMDEAAYRAASFLDDRILSAQTEGAWVPVERVTEAARALPGLRPLHFIFHMGHVGSTLLSRLLDETGVVLGLREPFVLRQLAEAPDPDLMATMLRLWGRGFPSTRAVIVKATSSAARIAPQLLEATDELAIYMYLPPEPYLATLLAGENSPIDLNGHRVERTARLSALLSEPAPPVASLGELAALSWLAERLTMESVIAAHGARVMALDFDAMLADVAGTLRAVTGHFGLTLEAAQLNASTRSPALTRYSKAPEHEYTPQFRAEILAQSRAMNANEIRKGLAWLKNAAARNAYARALLQ